MHCHFTSRYISSVMRCNTLNLKISNHSFIIAQRAVGPWTYSSSCDTTSSEVWLVAMTTGCLNNVMLVFINLILHLCCMFNNYVHNLSIYLVKTIAQDFHSKHQFRGTASAHTGFYCISKINLYIIMYIFKCLLLLVKAPSLPIIFHDILVTKCIDILWNLYLYNISTI